MLGSGRERGCVDSQDIALLKLTRALKSLRAVRILRSFRFVRGLRVLVKACRCFLPSLFWSMALLAVFVAMGALTLGNTLQVYILDDTLEHEDRQWLWDHYGTLKHKRASRGLGQLGQGPGERLAGS